MKTTVTRDSLYPALARVAPLAPNARTIPIVGTVRLETGPDGMAVTATDLACWLLEQVDGAPREEWSGCVDAERLLGLVKTLAGDITLEGDDRALWMAAGGVRARLFTLPAAGFPGPPPFGNEEPARFEIEATTLTATLKFCGQAAAEKNDPRYFLQGVHVGRDGVAAASDGHRLAVRRVSGELDGLPEGGIIIPNPACDRLLTLLRGRDGSVTVAASSRCASFSYGAWLLTTKLIDGSFADYRRFLPPRSTAPVLVNRAAAAAACERIHLMGTGKTRAVRLEAGEQLTLSGAAPEAQIDETVPISGAVPAVITSAKVDYIAKALDVVETDEIELHFGDNRHPIWICAAGEEHDGIVIMPIRL